INLGIIEIPSPPDARQLTDDVEPGCPVGNDDVEQAIVDQGSGGEHHAASSKSSISDDNEIALDVDLRIVSLYGNRIGFVVGECPDCGGSESNAAADPCG